MSLALVGTRRFAAVIFVVAIVARLAFAMTMASRLPSSDDAAAYEDLARQLVTDGRFVTTVDPPHTLDVPHVQRAPLTPFALAAAYALFGDKPLVTYALLAIIGGLTAVGVFLLGQRLFSTQVAVVAALLAATDPFFLFLASRPLTENLGMCLFTYLALALVSLGTGAKRGQVVAAGVLFALAVLNRPQVLGLLALLPIWLWMSSPARWHTRYGVIVLLSALVVGPWILRNRMVSGRWTLVTAQGGIVLWEANNPYTGTALARLEHGSRGWYDDERWNTEIRQGEPADLDRQAFRLAVDFIAHHPLWFLEYASRRVRIFFAAYDHPVHRFSWYSVAGLSCLGLYWTRSRWRELVPLYMLILETLLVAAVFTSMPRFRAPIEPILILFAALGLCELWQRTHGRPKFMAA